MREISDEHLVHAARAGDPRAFDELVRRHYDAVLARALRILDNREDALDVAQEVFLKAHRSLDQIRDGRTVRGWLGAIGVRLALNRAKRDRMRRMLSWSEETAEPAAADNASDLLEEADRARRAQQVRREILRLSPAQRTAFHLHHTEQMPFREVAQWMGNSEATARVLYFQAIRLLRKVLEEEE